MIHTYQSVIQHSAIQISDSRIRLFPAGPEIVHMVGTSEGTVFGYDCRWQYRYKTMQNQLYQLVLGPEDVSVKWFTCTPHTAFDRVYTRVINQRR
jgi:hypothetical protein